MVEAELPVESLEEPVVDLDPPQITEPVNEPIQEPTPDTKVHPLSPGGIRFEQVYAQSKQAQRDVQALREQLAATEAKLKAVTTPQETAYTDDQLEMFVAQGRMTQAEATAYRLALLKKQIKHEVKEDFQKETEEATREAALSRGIYEYVSVMPQLTDVNSVDRQRVDQEFDWQVSIQGKNAATLSKAERKSLELAALRTVFGPANQLRARTAVPHAEPSQGLPGGMPPRRSTNPDQIILDRLSKREVEHYKKMMRAGRYPGGWSDVVAEIKYEPSIRKA